MNKKVQLSAGALLLLFFLSISLFTACSEQNERVVKIGLLMEESESEKIDTISMERAADLFIDHLNSDEGYTGLNSKLKVEFSIFKNGNAFKGCSVDTIEQYITSEAPFALIWFPKKSYSKEITNLAVNNGVLTLIASTNAGDTPENSELVFHFEEPRNYQADIMAFFLRERLYLDRTAILYEKEDDTFKDLAERFKEKYTELGGEVVAAMAISSSRQELTEAADVAELLNDTQPEAVYIAAPAETAYPAATAVRMVTKESVILGYDNWNENIIQDFTAFQNSFIVKRRFRSLQDQYAETVITDYQNTYDEYPGDLFFSTYDALTILFHSIEQAGSVSADRVREEIINLDRFEGISGYISYNRSGHFSKDYIILKIDNQETRVFDVLHR